MNQLSTYTEMEKLKLWLHVLSDSVWNSKKKKPSYTQCIYMAKKDKCPELKLKAKAKLTYVHAVQTFFMSTQSTRGMCSIEHLFL